MDMDLGGEHSSTWLFWCNFCAVGLSTSTSVPKLPAYCSFMVSLYIWQSEASTISNLTLLQPWLFCALQEPWNLILKFLVSEILPNVFFSFGFAEIQEHNCSMCIYLAYSIIVELFHRF